MKKLVDYINTNDLSDQLLLTIPDVKSLQYVLKTFSEKLNSDKDGFYNNFSDIMFLIFNEDISTSIFNTDNDVDISGYTNILQDYQNGVIPVKQTKIWKNYNIKVYEDSDKYVSYKGSSNHENLNNEVLKVITAVDEDDILKDFLDKLCATKYAEEFLNINNKPSKMLLSDNIFIYSALLNYKKSIIDLSQNYKNKLSSNFTDNWDKIAKLFKRFLDELNRALIKY